MAIPNTTMIAIAEAKSAVDPAEPLEARLRSAMKVTYRHWVVTNEDEQFKAAVGAVMLSATEEERARLTAAMRSLGALSALLSGLPIDVERMANEMPEAPIPLLSLWEEVKA